MKRLCLIRHAKTTWNQSTLDDFNRPLDERGEHDAADLGKFLLEQKIKPDLVLSSPAKRAVDTASIIAAELHYPAEKIETDQKLYNAGVEELLATIQDIDETYNMVCVVGHNPGLTWLANYLAEDHVINLPTCGVYCVDFDTNTWRDITVVEGKTYLVETPKHLHEHDHE